MIPFDPNWDIEMAADEAAYSDMREEFGHLTLWSFLKYLEDDENEYDENRPLSQIEIAYKTSRIPIIFENPTLSA